MAADTVNVTYAIADSYAKELTATSKSTGLPIPLAGSTVKLHVDTKQKPVGTLTELFTVDCVITDEDAGKVAFTPLTTDTDIAAKKYYYRLRRTLGTDIRTISRGEFEII